MESARAAYPLREIVTFDQFHHERVQIGELLESVDGGDAGVVQCCEEFCFQPKARQPVSVLRERRWEDLDRDLALQFCVRRPIDLAHSTFADLRGDLVDAEARSGCEGQAVGL